MTVLPSAMRPRRPVLQRVCPGETAVDVRLRISYQPLLKDLVFAFPTPRRAVQKSKCPSWRSHPLGRSRRQGRVVCVHWSEAKPLTGKRTV